MLTDGEAWMIAQNLPEAATWTSAAKPPLIDLYRRFGYEIVARHIHDTTQTPMIKLAKRLHKAAV